MSEIGLLSDLAQELVAQQKIADAKIDKLQATVAELIDAIEGLEHIDEVYGWDRVEAAIERANNQQEKSDV